jgi:ATPase subunit of ABC transporter with duplicated ATPase domains
MAPNEVIIRFSDVSFGHVHKNPLLVEANFTVRDGSKITIMGQNGAGKSTIFNLITGNLKPTEGTISIKDGSTIAIGKQVIPREQLDLTVKEFFESVFDKKVYNIDPKIKEVLEVVNLNSDDKKFNERKIKTFSGGQQARLLLAQAIIQEPDILLLDEPTNNLDKEGIAHLTKFLINYDKTVLVISHDADFLNAFTYGVLYLDIFTKKVEQYVGNYFKVVEEIKKRLERERMQNVRLEKDIANRKKQAGFFAQKGGKLRNIASKMHEKIEELEEEKVDVRREDKTIANFTIQNQDLSYPAVKFSSISTHESHHKKGKENKKKMDFVLRKKQHLLISGPNGIGKSTFLESLVNGTNPGAKIESGVIVGYYRQDFSSMDFNDTAYNTLVKSSIDATDQDIRSVAAKFLITGEMLAQKVGSLSEGQKGLLAFASFVLQKPGLLILDEPTNHINFRHLPIIAKALDKYEGAMILVSHMHDFVKQIKIDEEIDLGKI